MVLQNMVNLKTSLQGFCTKSLCLWRVYYGDSVVTYFDISLSFENKCILFLEIENKKFSYHNKVWMLCFFLLF